MFNFQCIYGLDIAEIIKSQVEKMVERLGVAAT